MTLNIEWGGLHTVISGGQTGADQGGLLGAWRMGVKTGGQAAAQFKVEGGYNPILEVMGLAAGGDYAARTKANVRNADGTVIIAYDLRSPGTLLTAQTCRYAKKPLLMFEITKIVKLSLLGPHLGIDAVMTEIVQAATELKNFIVSHQIQVLNVAGNRELKAEPGHGVLVVTNIAEWIVSLALEFLEHDGKLIRVQQ